MTGTSKVVRKANSRLNTTWNMSQCEAASYFLFQWLSLHLSHSNFPYIPPLYVYVDMGWMCRMWCKSVHAYSTVSACLLYSLLDTAQFAIFTFSYSVLHSPMCSPNTHRWGANQNTMKKCPCLWFALAHCWLGSATLHNNCGLLLCKLKDVLQSTVAALGHTFVRQQIAHRAFSTPETLVCMAENMVITREQRG